MHLAFRFVNAIPKVRRTTLYMLYKYRWDVELKLYYIAKNECSAFKMNIFCVSKPTFNSVPHIHVGSYDEAVSTRRWSDWWRRENRWHIVVTLLFSAVIKALIALHQQGLLPVFNYDLRKCVNAYCIQVIMCQFLLPSFVNTYDSYV